MTTPTSSHLPPGSSDSQPLSSSPSPRESDSAPDTSAVPLHVPVSSDADALALARRAVQRAVASSALAPASSAPSPPLAAPSSAPSGSALRADGSAPSSSIVSPAVHPAQVDPVTQFTVCRDERAELQVSTVADAPITTPSPSSSAGNAPRTASGARQTNTAKPLASAG